MNRFREFGLALALAALVGSAAAAQADPHQGHHAAGATTNAPMAAPKTNEMKPGTTPTRDQRMSQMAAMREMHDKMMAARTPAERQALMAEHMRVMHSGMRMMQGMASGGGAGMHCDRTEHEERMDDRMQMMQEMMQLMMDRMPEASAH